MYEVSDELCCEMSARLMEAIGDRDFFAGAVTVMDGDTELRLVCSVVVHHGEVEAGMTFRPIKRLLPIWWECRTTVHGEEVMNDFSFWDMVKFI